MRQKKIMSTIRKRTDGFRKKVIESLPKWTNWMNGMDAFLIGLGPEHRENENMIDCYSGGRGLW